MRGTSTGVEDHHEFNTIRFRCGGQNLLDIMLRINALSCHAYDTGFMNSVFSAVSVSRGRTAKAFDARKDRQEIAPAVGQD
jgi:hypothetical protein